MSSTAPSPLVNAALATAAAAALACTAELHAQNRIEVSLSKRELYAYSGQNLTNTFPVAIGTRDHPTPAGDYTIDLIIWNPGWVPPDSEWAEDATRKAPGEPGNPMQGAKLYFSHPAYYIHGTNAPETLGERASHGCIRMNEVDVENLAEWVQKSGGADRSEAWFRDVRASDTDKREIELPNGVPITIRR